MIKYFFITLFTLNFFFTSLKAQERKLKYDVIRNGKIIGNINFVEIVNGQKRFLTMNSDVKTKYIFAFTDITSESAGYENGILVYSSFYQKQTGSGETNKSTIAVGKAYKVTDDGNSRMVNFEPIRFGMLKLYVQVPDTVSKIFSGNYQKLLDIKKIAENKYRLELPDHKYNTYTYKNGICIKVEIVRPLVSLEFVLKEIK